MKVEIKSRWDGSVIYATEIPDDTPSGMATRIALERADLRGADLRGAVLSGAVLRGAVLSDADLRGADLRGARSLWNAHGNRREIKSLQVDTYGITYTATHMQIGCHLHEIERWWSFSDGQIASMDSDALEWWQKWKPVLQQIIEMSPAVPGGEKPEGEPQ